MIFLTAEQSSGGTKKPIRVGLSRSDAWSVGISTFNPAKRNFTRPVGSTRELLLVVTYLYARAGEVNALRWQDVDLERAVVHVHASMNRDTGARKSTKTGDARRVPIERELLPLLRAMHDESGGCGAVAPVRATDRKLSRQLRRCLALAGVTRAELLAMGDPTRKAMTFHDLRATGITWCAVRGDDPLKVKQRAGHRTFSTTEGYIREAENLADGFGEVFPPLPPSLLVSTKPRNRRRVFGVGFGFRLRGNRTSSQKQA